MIKYRWYQELDWPFLLGLLGIAMCMGFIYYLTLGW